MEQPIARRARLAAAPCLARVLRRALGVAATGTALGAIACSDDPSTPASSQFAGGAPGADGAGGAAAATGGASSGGAGGGTASAGGAATSGGASSAGGTVSAGDASSGGAAPQAGGSSGAGGAPGAGRSAGCGRASTLVFGQVPGESGSSVGTGEGGYVTLGSRGFAMRLPDNYDSNRPYWLVFGFHWFGGNSKEVDTGGSNGDVMAHFGLQKLSNNGAIFVAPDGLNAGWANVGGQDLMFVDDMIRLIGDNYCVDTTRLFANGFSYGGGMTYALACARASVFRGVAIYEGAPLSGCEGGNDPIALWQMVGLEDGRTPIGLSTPIRDRFVSNNGCAPQVPPQPPAAPPYLNPGGHVCTDYQGCSPNHPLRWCVHQSGHGSAIVDGTGDLYNSCATPPSTCSTTCPCSWVPDDVWRFFTSL